MKCETGAAESLDGPMFLLNAANAIKDMEAEEEEGKRYHSLEDTGAEGWV